MLRLESKRPQAERRDGMSEEKTIKIADVVIREDIMRPSRLDEPTVGRYASDVEVLPPIEINQHNILIDGWHRLTAHRRAGCDEIQAVITETTSDADLLYRATKANATHGLQMSQADKRHRARQLFQVMPTPERAKELAKMLSVTPRTIANWTKEIADDVREQQQDTARKMWLLCHTQEQIAEAVDVKQPTVAGWLKKFIGFGKFSKSDKDFALFDEEGWTPPLYTKWTPSKNSNEVKHPGNSPEEFVHNLMWMCTKPYDVVLDLFAGGGSTVDACLKRSRRVWASDIAPKPGREHEIREHDITAGLPKGVPWESVRLAYLDPPYWRQLQGQYTDKPNDLSNLGINAFHDTLETLLRSLAEKLSSGARIALLIQPTQWKADDKECIQFHDVEMQCRMRDCVDARLEWLIQTPYATEVCTPQMVSWAQSNKRPLSISRTLTVWQVI